MAGLELLSAEGLRIDGRRPEEIRKFSARLGSFTKASGSATLELGNTKVIASVFGPHETTNKSNVLHDKAVVKCQYFVTSFSSGERRRANKNDRRLIEVALLIEDLFNAAIMCQLFPRSQIDICLNVLQSDGGVLSTCINAVCLALVDAGIPMEDYVCSCTASLIDDFPLLDVNYLEESSGAPKLTLAMFPRSKKVILCHMDCKLHQDNFEKVLDSLQNGCQSIFQLIDKTVRVECLQNCTGDAAFLGS